MHLNHDCLSYSKACVKAYLERAIVLRPVSTFSWFIYHDYVIGWSEVDLVGMYNQSSQSFLAGNSPRTRMLHRKNSVRKMNYCSNLILLREIVVDDTLSSIIALSQVAYKSIAHGAIKLHPGVLRSNSRLIFLSLSPHK